MNPDIVAANLALVEGHFHSELRNEIESALALYTDDIVWEGPARGVRFVGKAAVEKMYRAMFASMKDVRIEHRSRVADEHHVFDDSTMWFTLVASGIENMPFPVGTHIELRFIHIFEIRDGKICKETTFEVFKPAGEQGRAS
jgi:ketosteroid isomerase-like protein